jgi:RNA-binding protein YlmH
VTHASEANQDCLTSVQTNGFTNFMDDPAAVACRHKAHAAGFTSSELWGGFAAAERRIVYDPDRVQPEQLLRIVRFEPTLDVGAVQSLLVASGVQAEQLGDIRRVSGSLEAVVIVRPEIVDRLAATEQVVAVEAGSEPAWKTVRRIAASMRADALGAAAFDASRSWFSKGIASGNVYVNGQPAGKSSRVDIGGEIYARGLGRAWLLDVGGETRRGRTHVTFRLERSD